MKRMTRTGSVVFLFASSTFAAQQVPLDHAYMVNAVGSTTPVSTFDVNGPAPVLYLDLPSPAWGQYSYGSSNWFAGAGTNSLLSVASEGIFTSASEYWLTPTEAQWDSAKTVGNWHVNASYGQWDLVMVYGSGAPVTKAQGGATVNFSTVQFLPGDANRDGTVNGLDFNILASNFGCATAQWEQADFNYDGLVNSADFTALSTNFNHSISSPGLGTLIPEPACIFTFGLFAGVFLQHRRR